MPREAFYLHKIPEDVKDLIVVYDKIELGIQPYRVVIDKKDKEEFYERCWNSGVIPLKGIPENKRSEEIIEGLRIVEKVLQNYPGVVTDVKAKYYDMMSELKAVGYNPYRKVPVREVRNIEKVEEIDPEFHWDFITDFDVLITFGDHLDKYFFSWDDAMVAMLATGDIRKMKTALTRVGDGKIPGLALELPEPYTRYKWMKRELKEELKGEGRPKYKGIRGRLRLRKDLKRQLKKKPLKKYVGISRKVDKEPFNSLERDLKKEFEKFEYEIYSNVTLKRGVAFPPSYR